MKNIFLAFLLVINTHGPAFPMDGESSEELDMEVDDDNLAGHFNQLPRSYADTDDEAPCASQLKYEFFLECRVRKKAYPPIDFLFDQYLGSDYGLAVGSYARLDSQTAIFYANKSICDDRDARAVYLKALILETGPDNIGIDLPSARCLYLAAADAGVAKAQQEIADIYSHGNCGFGDDKIAMREWFEDFSSTNSLLASYYSGLCYMTGQGCPIDNKRAAQYFRKPHKKGLKEATYNLGVINDRRGDYQTAVKFFTAAAKKGAVKAHFALANYYQKGLGVERDINVAFMHLAQAASQGDPAARAALQSFQKPAHHIYPNH